MNRRRVGVNAAAAVGVVTGSGATAAGSLVSDRAGTRARSGTTVLRHDRVAGLGRRRVGDVSRRSRGLGDGRLRRGRRLAGRRSLSGSATDDDLLGRRGATGRGLRGAGAGLRLDGGTGVDAGLGRGRPVGVRLRVDPELDARTHIGTGLDHPMRADRPLRHDGQMGAGRSGLDADRVGGRPMGIHDRRVAGRHGHVGREAGVVDGGRKSLRRGRRGTVTTAERGGENHDQTEQAETTDDDDPGERRAGDGRGRRGRRRERRFEVVQERLVDRVACEFGTHVTNHLFQGDTR